MNTKIIIVIVLLVILLAVGGYFLLKPAPVAAPTGVDEDANFDAALALLGGGESSDVVEEFTTKECDDVLKNITQFNKMVEESNYIGRLKEIRDQIQMMDKEILKFKDCPRVGPAYRNFKRMVVKKFQDMTKDLCSKMSTILNKYSLILKKTKSDAEIDKIMFQDFTPEIRKVIESYGLDGPSSDLIFIICPNMKKEYLSLMQVVISKRLEFDPKVKRQVRSLCGSLKKLLTRVRSVKTLEQYNLVTENLQRVQSGNGSLLSLCLEYWDIMITLSPLSTKFEKPPASTPRETTPAQLVEPFSQYF